jgi:acyl-CoA thioester hydrolase
MAYPSIEQLRELPLQLGIEIPREWEDRNGHVNVQFYLTLYELGGWVVLEELGVDEDWFNRHQVSQFDLEHHLNYRAELKVGDQVSTYSRVLGRGEKRFHGMYFIVNETRQMLAATLEYVTAGVDMKTRRSAPFREDLASGLDRIIEKHKGLSWDAPVCGSMNP